MGRGGGHVEKPPLESPYMPSTCSVVLGNVKDHSSHSEFLVMDIGKQLASVNKDNLPFDQSCTSH